VGVRGCSQVCVGVCGCGCARVRGCVGARVRGCEVGLLVCTDLVVCSAAVMFGGGLNAAMNNLGNIQSTLGYIQST
jgi:hypothetical protein